MNEMCIFLWKLWKTVWNCSNLVMLCKGKWVRAIIFYFSVLKYGWQCSLSVYRKEAMQQPYPVTLEFVNEQGLNDTFVIVPVSRTQIVVCGGDVLDLMRVMCDYALVVY